MDVYGKTTPTSAWSTVHLPLTGTLAPGVSESLQLSFIDARRGWLAIGTAATPNSATSTLLATTDGGRSWASVAGPAAMPAAAAIRFTSPTDGFITHTANASTSATHDGGRSWTPLTLPAPAGRPDDTAQVTTGTLPITAGNIELATAILKHSGRRQRRHRALPQHRRRAHLDLDTGSRNRCRFQLRRGLREHPHAPAGKSGGTEGAHLVGDGQPRCGSNIHRAGPEHPADRRPAAHHRRNAPVVCV